MRPAKCFWLLAIVGLFVTATPRSQAQVSINIGSPPVCPYGYYDYAPYSCAPMGYYGPEWFSGGVFVGAGPWFHGPEHFRGHVDNHYDVQHGYKGALPQRGEHPVGHPPANFHGNEMRDGHGHTVR
jgi:hypothetical protein